MKNPTKGVSGIRTMARLVDGRKTRTPAGALLELSALANEKQLLNRELQRWARRHGEISARLGEIRAKEDRLLQVAQGAVEVPLPNAPDNSTLLGSTRTSPPCTDARAEALCTDRLRTQDFSY